MAEFARPIAADIVGQAVAWFVRQSSGQMTEQERHACTQWRQLHPDHELAWSRLHAMQDTLQQGAQRIPAQLDRDALLAAGDLQGRRHMLKLMGWLGAGGVSAWLLKDQPVVDQLIADYSTATGAQRQLQLADGTRLWLNTATALDVDYDSQRRHLHLRRGELMVATSHDAAARPFTVSTVDGSVQPLGTRFVLRRDGRDSATHLAVLQGAVAIHAGSFPATVIHAGQQASFSPYTTSTAQALQTARYAWVDGMLSAERMRLDEFTRELGRYRPGWLHCDAAVAELHITGSFPLHGPDASEHILQALAATMPVRIRYLTRYWVSIGPA